MVFYRIVSGFFFFCAGHFRNVHKTSSVIVS
jgi:hypothetical protein